MRGEKGLMAVIHDLMRTLLPEAATGAAPEKRMAVLPDEAAHYPPGMP